MELRRPSGFPGPPGQGSSSSFPARPLFLFAGEACLGSSVNVFLWAASAAVILGASLVLYGWALDIEGVKSIIPGLPRIMPNTALGLLVAAVSIWLMRVEHPQSHLQRLQRRAGQTGALAVALLGLLTLVEYVSGRDPGFDQLLFGDPVGTLVSSIPGRLSPHTALSFVLVGFGLLLLDAETRLGLRPAQIIILTGGLVCLVPLTGYLYSVAGLYGIDSYSGMALPTALSFLLLLVGALLARRASGLIPFLAGDRPGSLMARRLLVAVIAVPVVLGGIDFLGAQAGFSSAALGAGVSVWATVAALVAVVALHARTLDQGEAERRRWGQSLEFNQPSFANIIEENPNGVLVVDRSGTVRLANRAAKAMVDVRERQGIGELWRSALAPGSTAEIDITRHDGRPGVAGMRADPIEREGQLAYMVLIRDVTERKWAEDRLEHRIRELALFPQLSPAPVLSFDPDGLVLSANPAAVDFLGEGANRHAPLASLVAGTADLDLDRCIRDGLIVSSEARVGERHFQFVIQGVPELGIGHVYGSDVTGLKAAEGAQKECEESARRLAHENEVIAAIGRIVGSTLDIGQVYEMFAAEVKKLVDFDRIVINDVDPDAGIITAQYLSGIAVEGPGVSAQVALEGTGAERVLRTGQPVVCEDLRTGEGYSGDQARLWAGLRSSLAVPLFNKGRTMGTLTVHSVRVGAYGPTEQDILERLASQIAPALENARLHVSLQQAHDDLESRVEARTAENAKIYQELQASTKERAVVDEIARIVSSTLDIDQVYEEFAAEVKKLVSFDRITINVVDVETATLTNLYMSGVKWEGREIGVGMPIAGTVVEQVLRTGRTFLRKEIKVSDGLCGDDLRLRTGLKSMLAAPLTSKGCVVGSLTVHSRSVGTYGPSEQAILERLADQIAPAVENARLYQQLRASTEEKAVVDEVARIVTSTLDIRQVYEQFAAELKKLVGFDRINVNVIDHDAGVFVDAFVFGILYEGESTQSIARVPHKTLQGSVTEWVMRTGRPLLREDIMPSQTFKLDPHRLRAGLRSSLAVPLFSKGRVTGILSVHCCKVGSFGLREQALLERLADQIAPAVENARLYDAVHEAHDELESRVEARTMENARLYQELRISAEEKAVVDEVAHIVTSTLDIDQVYEKFASEVKKLVGFDRICINLIDREAGTFTVKYLLGVVQPGRRAGDVIALQGNVPEQTMAAGEASISENLAARAEFPVDQELLEMGLRSRIMLPLVSAGTTIGTISLHCCQVNAYGPREQSILRRLADQIAPAVENAELYQATDQLAQALASIGDAVTFSDSSGRVRCRPSAKMGHN